MVAMASFLSIPLAAQVLALHGFAIWWLPSVADFSVVAGSDEKLHPKTLSRNIMVTNPTSRACVASLDAMPF